MKNSGSIEKRYHHGFCILIFLLAISLSPGCVQDKGSDDLRVSDDAGVSENDDFYYSGQTGADESGGGDDINSGSQDIVNDFLPEDPVIPGEPAADENFVPSNTRLSSFVPATANGVISIDAESAVQSEIFTEMIEVSKAGSATGSGLSGYMEFMEKTGIDIETDIDSVIIAETGEGQKEEPSELFLTRLNRTGSGLIEDLMNNGYYPENYNGITVLTDPAGDVPGYSVALINQDTLAIGAIDLVKGAIDVLQGTKESILENEKLSNLINEFAPGSLVSFACEYPEDAKMIQDLGGGLSIDLTGARAVTGDMNLSGNTLTGGISLIASNADQLVTAFNSFKQMVSSSGGSLGDLLKNISLVSLGDRVRISISGLIESAGLVGGDLSPAGIKGRVFLKRFLYGMMSMNSAMQILRDREQPIIDFIVEDTPPSIFYNFIVPDSMAAALSEEIPLPENFTLAKIRLLEGDTEPHYYISLNIYRVTGVTIGLRAEWSTYIYDENDPTGKPRFMVIEARTDNYSMDPVDIITLPSAFTHDFENSEITTLIKDTKYWAGLIPYKVDYFESSIDLSGGNYTEVRGSREWIVANDFIYWKNGVCDRAFYNGMMHNGPLYSIDPGACTFKEKSKWADFIEPGPESVLVFGDRLEYAISPWYNISDDDLQLGYTAKRNRLFIKSVLYSMMSLARSAQIVAGKAQPLIRFDVAATPPSIFINYRVPDANAAALAQAIPLPEGYTLAKLRLLESDPEPYYYLCLNVYAVTGITNGLRAEWQVFVNVPNDPVDSAKPRCIVIEARTDNYSMDPVDIITFPGILEHAIDGNTIYTYAGSSGNTFFESTITLPEEGYRYYADGMREWLEANDYIYWLNGVCDKAYYSGTLVDVGIVRADPSDYVIKDTTQWMDFTDPDPESVLVFMNGLEFVLSPWWNL